MLKKIHLHVLIAFAFFIATEGCQNMSNNQQTAVNTTKAEVIYHIFLRSFYDSNGDGIGDISGIREKLGYLQGLGVTAILVTPIVQSVYYHNYFADNFRKIDPSYGTIEDWINLVKAIHTHGMKIYLDEEFQYVTNRQKWFKDSYKNPSSPYGKYVLYKDPANTEPVPIIYNISTLVGYNDSSRQVATVNLYDPQVQNFFYKLLKYWMDPNGDGKFDDGVDGFRLDHMMNNLDHKNILTDLFTKFWCPLITKLKTVNPTIILIAEQADWADYGKDYFDSASVDRVFAFNLRNAIVSFNKEQIASAADSTFANTPPGKSQIVFIENHDMERFASAVDRNPGKMRVGAALNLLIGGVPSVYYGQELGMFGKGGDHRFGSTDGNDIPQREAFEWYKADTGKGMAVWYKNTGPWWDSTDLKPNDGLSLQEEEFEPNSLWNWYRSLIHLHTSHIVFYNGKYAGLTNDNNQVFSFIRYTDDSSAVVAVNLSDSSQQVNINLDSPLLKWNDKNTLVNLFGNINPAVNGGRIYLQLPPYSVQVWEKE